MNTNARIITNDAISRLQSDYLAYGYKKDDAKLSSMTLYTDFCESVFDVLDAFLPSDGRFHLSMTTACNCIAQSVIIYTGLLNHLDKKESEIYLISLNMRFQQPVTDHQFTIRTKVRESKRSSRGIIYEASGDVQNKAFSFDAKFLFPVAGVSQ